MFSVGRLCIKTAGRECGRHCVVVKKDKEEGFVVVTGPKAATGVRRRRCNVEHLEPLELTIDIKADASDEEIAKIYEKEKLFEKLGIERKTYFQKPAKAEGKAKKETIAPKKVPKEVREESKTPKEAKSAEPKAATKTPKAKKETKKEPAKKPAK